MAEQATYRPPLDPAAREAERDALWHVIESRPASMDLPTVLWGASAALLRLRSQAARRDFSADPKGGSPDVRK